MTTDERLERLERELAHAKRVRRTANWLLCAMALGLVIAIWLGSCQRQEAAVKELRANRFVLEDENGNTRAGLTVLKDGTVLLLLDENGETRAMLTAVKDGSMLVLHDENGKTRVLLGVDKDGPRLDLYDENGKVRAALGAGMTKLPDGKKTIYPESSLRLFGSDGKMLWGAPR